MNIIYIHTHDSGRILGPYGYAIHTPNLNKFAEDALLFRQAYCVSPTCSPSRAGLLTGTYPHQNGMLGLAQRGFQLDYDKHIVRYLNQHQYHSVLCGIQHESGWYLDYGQGMTSLGYQEDITCGSSQFRQEDLGSWDMLNAQNVCAYLHDYDQKKPLFLSYGLYSTHRRYPNKIDESIHTSSIMPPYPIPDTPQTREDHAHYMTSAMQADACIGLVLDALKETGMYDDSIIIFTTDHGLANPFSKCTLFDSGIAVSYIMRTPRMKHKGEAVDELISHIDVFPTLCDILSFEQPAWLEGKSFASYFKADIEAIRNEIYAEVNFHTSYEPIRCIRTKRYKYIRYYDQNYLKINASNMDESLTKDYFIRHDLSNQHKYEEALYDMIYDMGERHNLIDEEAYQDVGERLSTQLQQHMINTCDPLCVGEIKICPQWKVNKKECQKASSRNENDYISLGK